MGSFVSFWRYTQFSPEEQNVSLCFYRKIPCFQVKQNFVKSIGISELKFLGQCMYTQYSNGIFWF